nr:coronin 6 [Parasacculina yatsui]
MSFRVRVSRFRHVFGQPLKKALTYENVRVSSTSWDTCYCSVGAKFVALIVECSGGGAFVVIPLNQYGRLAPDAPIVGGHKGAVLDIAWNPFNDNVIASASEDCLVKVWEIPDGGLVRTMQESVVDLVYHQRRVGFVVWHPTAENVLLSCGSDNVMVVWNVAAAEPLVVINTVPEQVSSACWSWNGSELLISSRDKKLRILDARTGQIKEEAPGHEGSKTCKAIFLKDGSVLTSGFSKMSERQYSLRRRGKLGEPVVLEAIDKSNGIMFLLYDPDTNIVFFCGKGDSVIRYFEYNDEAPYLHYISTFQASEPQRAIGMLPKRICDVKSCEITRIFRATSNGVVAVHPFIVPRKSEQFQEDLYPDTFGDTPALSAEEWAEGKDADPILVSMKDGFSSSSTGEKKKFVRKNIVFEKKAAPSQRKSEDLSPQLSEDAIRRIVNEVMNQRFEDFKRDMQLDVSKLKAVVVRQNDRVSQLEAAQSRLQRSNGDAAGGHVQQLGQETATGVRTQDTANGNGDAPLQELQENEV